MNEKRNIEMAELRQDTTEKQTSALETRIKFFQDLQNNQLQGQFLDLGAKIIMGVVELGKVLKEIIPEETQEKILKNFQDLLLSF